MMNGDTPGNADRTRPGGDAPRLRRLRRLGVASALIGAVLAARAGLSMFPRSPDEVTRLAKPPEADIFAQPVATRMVREGRGIPFRTYTIARGPAEAQVKTIAQVSLSPTGVLLNFVVAVVVAVVVVLLTAFARRRR